MKFTEFLKTVLTKKELNRFYKELQEYNPILYRTIHLRDHNLRLSGCFIFYPTRKGMEYWYKLDSIVERKKEKLIQ